MSDFDLSGFIASFFDEARDRLSSINQHLVALESGSLSDEELNSLRRDAHTIKGSALMLGVTDVGEMGHLFEDAMERLINHAEFRTGEVVQFLFDLHDRLAERLQDPDSQEHLDVPAYRRQFEQLCETIAAGGGAAAPAAPTTGEATSEASSEESQAPPQSTATDVDEEGLVLLDSDSLLAAVDGEGLLPPESTPPAAPSEVTSKESQAPSQSTAAEFDEEGFLLLDSDSLLAAVDDEGLLPPESITPAAAGEVASEESQSPSQSTTADVGEEGMVLLDTDSLLAAAEERLLPPESGTPAAASEGTSGVTSEESRAPSQSTVADVDEEGMVLLDSDSLLAAADEEAPLPPVSGTSAAVDAGEMLIGAEEAAAWKRSAAESVPQDTAPEEELAAAAAAGEEKTVPNHADMELAAENAGEFRPDLSQFEMQALGRRQSSGRYLRVDSDRLAILSNQVMELSIEKARSLGMLDQFSGLFRGMRELRRHWHQVQAQLEPLLQLRGAEESEELNALEELFERQLKQVQRFGDDLRYERDRNAIVLNDIRDQILSLMLRPLDSIFSTFPRAVRDTAMRFNRKVRLQIGGKSVEMDQGVAESLVEPLIHLLNNAIAHGIEPPEERRLVGKPEEGLISIMAKQSGSEVHIEVIDDGRGIDVDRVRKVAIERGVTTKFEADQMDSAEILEMIFRPGFSTHEDVDNIAGRGIGMNVVQDTVRKLTGSVRIQTEKGRGTRFLLSLPVSIAVQHALQFRIGGQHFGMLTHMIEQVMPLDAFKGMDQETEAGAGEEEKVAAVRYGKHHLPLVDLRHVLHGRRRMPTTSRPHIVIAEHIEGYVGIVVDELFEESEIIVRDIDPYLKRYQAPGLMGNTIVSDGSILLLIEPYGIKEMGRTAPDMALQSEFATQQAEAPQEAAEAEQTEEAEAGAAQPKVLLVEDSLIAREIEKGMLQSVGFNVRTAIDGVDALEKVRSEQYDMIVTDLEMPRLDGFGLVRQIRNESRFEDMPILVISTRESAEDRMRALDAGADAYLVKQQLSHQGLRDTLQKLLGSLTPGDDSNTNRPRENAPIV